MVSYLIPPDALPRWYRWLFPVQDRIQSSYGEYDAARPQPEIRIGFAERMLLTRPSLSSLYHGCEVESPDLIPLRKLPPQQTLMNVPLEIRQAIWTYVLGGHAIHLKLESKGLIGWACFSPDPSTCKNTQARECCGTKKMSMISLLLSCRQMWV